MKTKKQLEEELGSFKDLWHGGTKRPKFGWEKSKRRSVSQDLDGIVETCISPYMNNSTTVLEIGAGGGFWTQRMLDAKKICCFDALSAEHNKFWDRVPKGKIEYFQVKDFLCSDLEDDSIDYLFSYDVFCHISYSGADAYLKNLHKKLKTGANCFIMIGDINKYQSEVGKKKLVRVGGHSDLHELIEDDDGDPTPGRWYLYGVEKFCELLDKYEYSLVSKDVAVDLDKNSPIIHFKK